MREMAARRARHAGRHGPAQRPRPTIGLGPSPAASAPQTPHLRLPNLRNEALIKRGRGEFHRPPRHDELADRSPPGPLPRPQTMAKVRSGFMFVLLQKRPANLQPPQLAPPLRAYDI